MKSLLLTCVLVLMSTLIVSQATADSNLAVKDQAFAQFMNAQVNSLLLFKKDGHGEIRMGIGIGPSGGCVPRIVCTTDSDCDGGKCEVHSNFPAPYGPRHCVCY